MMVIKLEGVNRRTAGSMLVELCDGPGPLGYQWKGLGIMSDVVNGVFNMCSINIIYIPRPR